MSWELARVYIALWSLLVAVALVSALRAKPRLVVLSAAYLRWLLRPWKLATFAVAFSAMVVVAPYTGDPTWDYVTGGVQSLLTFVTAPWAVGTLYRRVRRIHLPSPTETFCAATAWLVSASWFYDGYLTWRDGRYPDMWDENLPASSALYLLAGMLWSLTEAAPGRGVLGATLAFHEPDWPNATRGGGRGVSLLATLIMLFTVALMVPFLLNAWSELAPRI